MDPEQEIRSRPTFEKAARDYRAQLVAVRDALREVAPTVAWDTGEPAQEGDSLCAPPFDGVRGASSAGFVTGGGGAIPDGSWDDAVAAARRVLRAEGYDKDAVIVDRPGEHSVSFYGPYGAEIVLHGERNTGITLLGGCFLEA